MKLQSIQFLRAIAALLVVYAHSIDLQMKYAVSAQQRFFYLQNFGAIGVDIFFVLSGFIITYSAQADIGLNDARQFLIKRFIRINPVYYIATFLYFLPYAIHWFRAGAFPTLPQDTLLKTIFILPFTDHAGWVYAFIPIGWTLSFEWFFYLLFLVLILDNARKKEGWMLLILCGLILFGLLLHGHKETPDQRVIFATNPIIGEFGLGVLICWLYRYKRLSRAIAFTFLAAALGVYVYEMVTGFGTISEAERILDGTLALQRLLAWGLPSALLVAGCVGLEQSGTLSRVWNNKWMGLTGDASYSIYLTHLIIFLLFDSLYLRFGFLLPADLAIWVQVIVAATAGIIFYKLIEAPLLRYMREHFTVRPAERRKTRPKAGSKRTSGKRKR